MSAFKSANSEGPDSGLESNYTRLRRAVIQRGQPIVERQVESQLNSSELFNGVTEESCLRVLEQSPNLEDTLGYPPQELISPDYEDYIGSEILDGEALNEGDMKQCADYLNGQFYSRGVNFNAISVKGKNDKPYLLIQGEFSDITGSLVLVSDTIYPDGFGYSIKVEKFGIASPDGRVLDVTGVINKAKIPGALYISDNTFSHDPNSKKFSSDLGVSTANIYSRPDLTGKRPPEVSMESIPTDAKKLVTLMHELGHFAWYDFLSRNDLFASGYYMDQIRTLKSSTGVFPKNSIAPQDLVAKYAGRNERVAWLFALRILRLGSSIGSSLESFSDIRKLIQKMLSTYDSSTEEIAEGYNSKASNKKRRKKT